MPRPSLRQAINQFCRECLYDPSEMGTWREQVEACTAKTCPLFGVRPKPSAKEKRDHLLRVQNGAVRGSK